MGQVRQDNVQIKLEIDGSQSRTELDNLTRKAQLLQDGLKGLKKGSEEYVAANKELSTVKGRMEELRAEIGLTALTSGQLKAMSNQLNRELANLTPNTESFLNKAKELANVDARLAQVRAEAKGVKDDFDNAGGGIGSFIAKAAGFAGIQLGVQAVASGLLDLGKSSVAEFQQAAGAAAQLDATITSTGASAGFTRQQLLDMSTALEGKTFFDGDAVTQAQSVLLGFQNIKGTVYKDALPAIADMAVKLAGDGEADLTGATKIVGKALESPLAGIQKLTKAGVDFPAGSAELVKGLLAVNDVAGAQRVILDALSAQYGGSAEAAAKAGTGPLKQFEVAIGNVKEGLGELILDGLQAIQPALAGALKLFAFFIEALKATPSFLVENRGLLLGLAVAILTLNAGNIAATASALALTVVEKGRAIATTASATATRLLGLAMSANPVGLFIAAIALLVGGLITLYEKSEKVREVFAGLGAVAKQVFASVKDIIINQLGSVATLLTGIFTFNPVLIAKGIAELGPALRKAGSDIAGAYHQGYSEREKLEQAAAAERDKQQQTAKVQRAKEAADKSAAADAAANLEALKNREANIKAALALVQAGSAEELRLKKQEVLVKRDIDLLGEKQTAGDRKVIRAEALRDLRQLQDDYDKKQADAAAKRAKEQADVEKKIADLRAAQIPDETERKIAQLNAAAEKEKASAVGTAQQIAEQRTLIEEKRVKDEAKLRVEGAQKAGLAELDVQKLNNSLIKNQFDRKDAEIEVAYQEALLKLNKDDKDYEAKKSALFLKEQEDLQANNRARVADNQQTLDSIAAIEEETAQIRQEKRRKEAANDFNEQGKINAEDLAQKLAKLDKGEAAAIQKLDDQYAAELISDQDYADKSAAIHENFLAKKGDLSDKFADDEKSREYKDIAEKLAYVGQALSFAGDLQKIASDKELARLDKDKTQRLAKLETEYKAGRISKESYEADKSAIETSYDAQTRAIKQQAAERDKEYQIANSIIQGTIAVLAAAAANAYSGGIFSPVAIATGIAAVAATAKIIATPIPEFEKGGFFSRVGQGIKQYATGGRINAKAGVADVGQRHSGGGIRMVDGATGEHLGEWERGEAYMILSRDTYANNKHLVDELIDTSLYRGGAPVRQGSDYFESGGTFNTSGTSPASTGGSAGQDLVQAVQRVEAAVREARDAVAALPSRQYIGWSQGDTAEIEDRLDERAADRNAGAIR